MAGSKSPRSAASTQPAPIAPRWPAQRRAAFRRSLLAWYRKHARDLPWRREPTPYRVWLSEMMLQQTQVATVVPYFERFVAAFPTLRDLAAADESRVLRLWEGLGYYRRARQLHAAAKEMALRHDGAVPADIADLQRLPGIGRYTAGAILSIAYDRPHPILEANTRRVYARLLGYEGDPRSAAAEQQFWQFAAELLPNSRSRSAPDPGGNALSQPRLAGPGALNQALMELGAGVCTPRNPDCEICPAAAWCRACQLGRQAEIPASPPKRSAEKCHEAAVLVVRDHSLLLVQRLPGERWAGLWDVPRFPHPAAVADLAAPVRAMAGLEVEIGPRLTTLRHGVTRFAITLDAYAARYIGEAGAPQPPRPVRWIAAADLPEAPLNATGRQLADLAVELMGCAT